MAIYSACGTKNCACCHPLFDSANHELHDPLIAIYYDEHAEEWTLLSRANASDDPCITTSSDLDELLSIGRDVATGG